MKHTRYNRAKYTKDYKNIRLHNILVIVVQDPTLVLEG